MRQILAKLRRWAARDDGNTTIEFVILFPMMMSIFGSSFEAAFISQRQALLTGAVDRTVRDLQLGNLGSPSHDELKVILCNRAGFIPKCDERLHVEQEIISKETWSYRTGAAQCVDVDEDIVPSINYTQGAVNNLMLLTVCAAIRPMVPITGLGLKLPKINDGNYYGLVVFSAYVVEPA